MLLNCRQTKSQNTLSKIPLYKFPHPLHCPAMKERDGYMGLKPLRNRLTEVFIKAGFIFHSEHCIWKDSTRCRSGIPDYLIAMRKPGGNAEPVAHENGLVDFIGDNPPANGGVVSHEIWRRYASPVWMDINQSNTLQKDSAREARDERHICPLQLDVIERALVLWSNPGDVIFSPLAGIASEGFQSIKMGRKFIGVELKESYYKQAALNLAAAEVEQVSLFSVHQ